MGLGPPKVMKSTFCSATTLPWKHRPPLCHLDRSAPGFPTSRCWLLPRVRLSLKRAACRSSKPRVSTGNPGSVVERSLCGCFFLGMFFDRGVMGLWPTQGDEKRLLFSNHSDWKHRPTLCHLDRSAPGFPTSRCWLLPRVRLSLKRAACRSSKPRVSTGNPGSVVERSAVQRSFLGHVFSTERTRGICSFCPLRNTSKSEHHHLYPEVAFLGMATRNSFKGFSILVPLVHHGRILP